MSVAPAGIGSSRSLSTIRSYVPLVHQHQNFFLTFEGALTERASPPPAESPERIIRSGGTGSCDPDPSPPRGGSIRKRYAARASWSAHGKGYCGARPALGPPTGGQCEVRNGRLGGGWTCAGRGQRRGRRVFGRGGRFDSGASQLGEERQDCFRSERYGRERAEVRYSRDEKKWAPPARRGRISVGPGAARRADVPCR